MVTNTDLATYRNKQILKGKKAKAEREPARSNPPSTNSV